MTSGAGSGGCVGPPLSTNQDRVYSETSSLSFSGNVSCFPEISDI